MLAVFVKLNSSDCKQNVKINVFEKKKLRALALKKQIKEKRKKKKEKHKIIQKQQPQKLL
jgi:hypothetical protein